MSDKTGQGDSILVAEFMRGESEAIRVSLDAFRGGLYLSLRQWWKPDHASEFVPTRKGVVIRTWELAALAEAIEQAREMVEGAESGRATE
jgi:hypothetical protein